MVHIELMRHELDAVLEALRRDMRSEESRAKADPEWADFHAMNARADRQLLQALNPKHTAPSAKRQATGHNLCGTVVPTNLNTTEGAQQ